MTTWQDPKLLVLLAAGSLIVMVGAVIAPILPEIVNQLHLDPSSAGSLVSLHYLTVGLASPLCGILADRIGQLRLLIPCLVLYALFGVSGAFLQDFTLLLVSRGLLGAASGGIAAASLGLLSRLYQGEDRSQAIAYVSSTLTLANIVYPLLGGWLGAIHWQWAFYLYGLALPLGIWALYVFQEDALALSQPKGATDSSDTSNSDLFQVLWRIEIWQLLLTLTLVSGAVYGVVVYLPLYLKATLGTGAGLNGTLLATQAIGAAVVSAFGVRRLTNRLGIDGTFAVGFGLMALSLIAIPNLHQLYWLVPVTVLFGLGFGIVTPSLYSVLADLTPLKLQSSVLAAGTGAGFLGQFLSPILLGQVFATAGVTGVFYTVATVIMGAGAASVLLLRRYFKSN
ncbi:MFS transporter [Leptolyngbya sp. FACHB-261]|uniref:MFS transporter n=1 Tax=Leptolyngbya sp. FACHB-261 TaxID=2692806 RepID=UPI0016874124|nr:MFS transporter [Leptolyngbya sp. FACHB-261]MBD2103866.1 MFS transporter [Leptolyngbya sp. FACHB-261]